MTINRDIERVLDHWFDDGPSIAPDRIVDEVSLRIGRQRQRPVWRVSPKEMHMTAYVKPALAAVAVVLLAIAGVTYFNPPTEPSIGGPAPSPSVTPARSTPAPTRPWWLAGTTGPCGEAPSQYGCAGELAAGDHTSGGLDPAITYQVPAGWVNVRDWVNYFSIFPDTPSNRAAIEQGGDPLDEIVILTIDTTSFECEAPSPSPASWTASDIASALAARDPAGAEPVAVTIGGLTGWSVDVTADLDWAAACPVATPSSPASGQSRYRLMLLDGPDGNVIAVHIRSASMDDFEAFVAPAMRVVQSFEFDIAP